jgi:hypothetical protein
MYASGNRVDIISLRLNLEPGVVPEYPSQRGILFNQAGVPEFEVTGNDLEALMMLLESPQISGVMATGNTITRSASGVVMPLISANLTEVFDNVAASMTEELRSRNDATAQGATLK